MQGRRGDKEMGRTGETGNRANQMRNDECGMRNERQRREPGAEEGGPGLRNCVT